MKLCTILRCWDKVERKHFLQQEKPPITMHYHSNPRNVICIQKVALLL